MMTSRNCKSILTGMMFGFVAICLPVSTPAGPMTGRCDDCHVMHDSQDGQPIAIAGILGTLSGPQDFLLKMDCIACHTGSNSATSSTPYVYDDAAGGPIYPDETAGTTGNTLAAGNFYWAQSYDELGHNVRGISAVDTRFGIIPPGVGAINPLTSQLECAGTNGCHGNILVSDSILSMEKTHHLGDDTKWKDGTTLPQSYRFLEKIQGYGDPDYEYQPTSNTHHNKYYGKDRTIETDSADTTSISDNTINSHCARCHQFFHNGVDTIVPSAAQIPGGGTAFGSGVWIPHPTDYDMSNATLSSTEYLNYNDPTGSGTNTYSVIAPVAVGGAANRNTVLNKTVNWSGDDAIIMCISCHRAHGSPYASSVRWSYRSWPASGFDGCSICHTTKD